MNLRIKEENGRFYIVTKYLFFWEVEYEFKWGTRLHPSPTLGNIDDFQSKGCKTCFNGVADTSTIVSTSYNFSSLDECRRFIQKFILDPKTPIEDEPKVKYHDIFETRNIP